MHQQLFNFDRRETWAFLRAYPFAAIIAALSATWVILILEVEGFHLIEFSKYMPSQMSEAIGLFVFFITIAHLLLRFKATDNITYHGQLDHPIYDVFVAAPMAATASEIEYATVRQETLQVVQCLRSVCGFKHVHFAGENISTSREFDAAGLAFKDDYEKLMKSRYFLLMFMRPGVSSALVEAGIALALGKTSVYLVQKSGDLLSCCETRRRLSRTSEYMSALTSSALRCSSIGVRKDCS
jgi:hypothetical protein